MKVDQNALRIVVAGTGRSGTSLIYQQLAKLLQQGKLNVNFRYEPYLWSIKTPSTHGQPFDVSQICHRGIQVHLEVPLFLDGSNIIHDHFLDGLFNSSLDGSLAVEPDAYLAKVIRGTGRLRSYLEKFPDLKIIACLRNPVDTINSSLGLFSFFGDEFHCDDRNRFKSELYALGFNTSKLGSARLSVEWYATWWRVFTETIVDLAEDFPENLFLFMHELYLERPDFITQSVMDFIGINNSGMLADIAVPAGTAISTLNLTAHDAYLLKDDANYYYESILQPAFRNSEVPKTWQKTKVDFFAANFSFPVAGHELGKKTSIQLRESILTGQSYPSLLLSHRPEHPLQPSDLSGRVGGLGLPSYFCSPCNVEVGKTFGVVITCFNGEATIIDAILSCLNQTLPFDQVVIVNDCSNDGSKVILDELAALYSSIKVIHLETNVGTATALDIGIKALSTTFFTRLDSDDLFWPTKNENEAATMRENECDVVFSDILFVSNHEKKIVDTTNFSGKFGVDIWSQILKFEKNSPRDMTLSREIYFEVGGYDCNLRVFEDWEFKLRLSKKSKLWKRAGDQPGTIVNNISTGIGRSDDGMHARRISDIFFQALVHSNTQDLSLISAFDGAIGSFKERHISKVNRESIQRFLLSSHRNVSDLATYAVSGKMKAKPNSEYISSIQKFVSNYGHER